MDASGIPVPDPPAFAPAVGSAEGIDYNQSGAIAAVRQARQVNLPADPRQLALGAPWYHTVQRLQAGMRQALEQNEAIQRNNEQLQQQLQ